MVSLRKRQSISDESESGSTNEAAKPFTRSKSKTIASQAQQKDENDELLKQTTWSEQFIANSRAPSGSVIKIKRI